MAINKVVFGNDTLIDLTEDSVSASNLLEGETAHDRSGTSVTGTAKQGHVVQNTSGTYLTQRAKLQFADADATDDAVNEKTVVNVVRERTQAQYDDMSAADKAKGIYEITDADAKPLFASQVRYDTNNTVADKLDSLSTSVADTVSKANGGVFGGNVTVDRKDGTASSEGFSHLTLGNATPVGTNQNSTGLINLYSETEYPATLYVNPLTQQRYIGLPDKNGTLALTSDLVKLTKVEQNVSVAANTAVDTFLNFGSIDTSKILMVQVVWSNPSNDIPVSIVYYCSGTNYVNKVQHKWSVAQTVKFKLLVLHT